MKDSLNYQLSESFTILSRKKFVQYRKNRVILRKFFVFWDKKAKLTLLTPTRNDDIIKIAIEFRAFLDFPI